MTNRKNTQIETLFSAVFHPLAVLFYLLELAVLFIPSVAAAPLPLWLQDIGFASRMAAETDFHRSTYLFAVIMAASLFVTPVAIRRIHRDEKNRLGLRFDEDPRRAVGAVALMFVLVPAFFYVVFFAFGDPTSCDGCTTSSRWRLFFAYGVFAPFLISYCIAALTIATAYLTKSRRAQ